MISIDKFFLPADPDTAQYHWWNVRLYLGDCECGRPLGAENVEANGAVAVDVGVVDSGREGELGRLERIVCWKVDVEEKDSALKWRL